MGLPVINIRYVPLTNTGNMVIKRAMDIVGSIFGIIITSPIMLISAILVKLSSPGPVIFKQERVGLHNKPFYMYKFRSMAMQTAAEEKKGWTVRNDPRVTGIGKVLRRTSIDELPQLFNILKGRYESGRSQTGKTAVCGKVQGRDSPLHGKTSGTAGTDRMGTGEWLSWRYFDPEAD